MFRSKPYLNKKCLLSLCYSYIHSYISYGNIAWGNTYLLNLKKISSQQKQSVCIIYNKMKYESIRKLLRLLKILNVYQINILNNVFFMHRINTNSTPMVFLNKVTRPSHLYPTRFSQLSYTKPTHKLSTRKYKTSIRRPYIWNEYLTKKKEKEIELTSNFKLAIKSKLLLSNNELSYF